MYSLQQVVPAHTHKHTDTTVWPNFQWQKHSPDEQSNQPERTLTME